MAVKRTRRTLNALDVSDGGYNFNHFPGNCSTSKSCNSSSSQNVALKTLVNAGGKAEKLSCGLDFSVSAFSFPTFSSFIPFFPPPFECSQRNCSKY